MHPTDLRGFAALAATLVLAGCGGGGGEDFAVDVERSPAQVIALLRGLDFGREQQELRGFRIALSRPGDREILFTIPAAEKPGAPSGESLVRLTLEPMRNGAATKIHAAVDVPPVRIMMGQANKVLSEAKVEKELRTALNRLSTPAHLHDLLAALAIASSVDLQAQVNSLQRAGASPFALSDEDGLSGESMREARAGQGDPAEPMDDPNAALERERDARARADRLERARLDRESAPMNDPSGEDQGWE